jgi:pimeloyl-ACP methyl ester carboxylesterase
MWFLAACSPVSGGLQSVPATANGPTPIPLLQPTPGVGVDDLPIFQPAACPFVLPEDYAEGEQVDCGYLLVPETRGDLHTRIIRLAVAIFHPPGGASEPDALVHLSGGPGASALELLRYQFTDLFEPLLEAAGRDLVIFDQRGVGRSQPALDCPQLDALSLELLDHESGGELLSDQQITGQMLDAIADCRNELSRHADLSAYNSPASAADVGDLAAALGYERVNLWGGSYGTRLALEVMRSEPSWVRSVVLEAVYPPDADLYLEAPANFQRALDLTFDSCAANPVCAGNYPDLREGFYAAVARLNEDPVQRVITNPLDRREYSSVMDGDALLGLVFQALYDTYFRYRLPGVLDDVARGEYDMVDRLRGVLVGLLPVSSRGMMFSVQCAEALSLDDLQSYEASLAAYPQIRGMYEYGLVGRLAYLGCQVWDVPPLPDAARGPVESGIPTLLMSGEFDPVTPPAWAQRAARALSTAYLFEYPGVGHGASAVDGCPRRMMIDFLRDPSRAPEAGCIEAMRN